MTSRNDITGDAIATKATTEAYRSNWDAIFGKKTKETEQKTDSGEKSQEDEKSSEPKQTGK